MLVRWAISSIIETFSEISRIAVTAPSTTSLVSRASFAIAMLIFSVCSAFSELAQICEVISSMDAEVSSTEAACSLAPSESV
jgi:hypothetical protein